MQGVSACFAVPGRHMHRPEIQAEANAETAGILEENGYATRFPVRTGRSGDVRGSQDDSENQKEYQLCKRALLYPVRDYGLTMQFFSWKLLYKYPHFI